MRLTLRTLLAYIDAVLGPGEHEDLHRRIQQSDDVGNLLRRVRQLTRQPELLSPPLMGKGLGGDPNSIAEYLDDVLHGPHVPELERICLESDEQLAELAHCHQLLATALQTQVVVPQSLQRLALAIVDPAQRATIENSLLTRTTLRSTRRDKMLVGVDPAEAAVSAGEAAVQVQAPMLASGGDSIRPEGLDLEVSSLAREVPEYLVGYTRAKWNMPLAILALAGLLGVLVWQSLGPWERVRTLFTATPSRTLAAGDSPRLDRALEPAEVGGPSLDQVVISDESPPPPDGVERSPEASPLETDADTASPAGAAPAGDTTEGDLQPIDQAPPAPATTSDDDQPLPTAGANDNPAVDELSVADQAVWSPQDAEQQNAVVLSGSLGSWKQLAAGQPIGKDDQVIVPPATRTQFNLPDGWVWLACGPTQMQIENTVELCVIKSSLCQALVNSQQSHPVQLQTPAGNWKLSPADASTVLAIEIAHRPAAHGSVLDPRTLVPVLVITVVEGGAKIESMPDAATRSEDTLEGGEAWAVMQGEGPATFKLQTVPVWFSSSLARAADRLAVDDLQERLAQAAAEKRNVSETLAALASHRRPETASLAIQTSMLLGEWEPLVEQMLTSDRFRSYWTPSLDLAQQALVMRPQTADELLELLVKKHGAQKGNYVFQLLTGLPEDQLLADGVAALITELDSNDLTHRILAAYHLQKLTGKLLAYQPHAPNRSSVQQWRREQAMKRLPLLPQRDPIWERLIP